MEEPPAGVDALRARANDERRAGNLESAADLLEQVVEAFDASVGRCDQDAPPTPTEIELASELAETLGLLGGVHRRRGDLGAAVEAYRRGRSWEANDRYRLTSTYATLNWVVASVLTDPASLDGAGEVGAELDRVRRTFGDRADLRAATDPWARGDQALAASLAGEAVDDLWRDVAAAAPPGAVDAYAATLEQLAQLDTPSQESLRAGLSILRGANP